MTWAIHEGDCLELMRAMAPRSVDHVIVDPPYSKRTHDGIRAHGRKTLKGGNGKVTARVVDVGFPAATPAQVSDWMTQYERVARRWVLVFTDLELVPLWRRCARERGLRYVQALVWDRVGGAPQFSGRGPAACAEFILAFHVRGVSQRWNGGGKRGMYTFPVVANRFGQRGSRIFAAQKPENLMMALTGDFTDLGDSVLDSHAGSGTTGAACIRLGRDFTGIELDSMTAALARARLSALEKGTTLHAGFGDQAALFEPWLATERARGAKAKRAERARLTNENGRER
jgi:DNA modification methylase